MTRFVRFVVGILAGVALMVGGTSPAYAGDARIDTTSVIRMMPDQITVFHDGDPIRVCAMTVPEFRVEGTARVAIEERRAGHEWTTSIMVNVLPGHMFCVVGVVHGRNDISLRVRTYRNARVEWSVSRTVTVRIAR